MKKNATTFKSAEWFLSTTQLSATETFHVTHKYLIAKHVKFGLMTKFATTELSATGKKFAMLQVKPLLQLAATNPS